MNILLLDAQGILSSDQRKNAERRLYYSLSRFDHRVNGATIHFSLDAQCERVTCTINVSVEGVGIVAVSRSSDSSSEVLGLAVDAIEPKVACRVDWRMWFNADTFATWVLSVSQPLKALFGFDRLLSRWVARQPNGANKPNASGRNLQGQRRQFRLGAGNSGGYST
jgi:hypothetical protein